jgi:hypothetical protein
MNDTFVCLHCGKRHHKTELSFAASLPDPYFKLSRDERETRAILGSDQCVIDGEQFYIRGCLELPVIESERVFLWGVWARVHEKDYDEIEAHWTAEGREGKIGPYKGRLANSLPIYAESLNLKLEVQIEPVGSRPLFFLEDPDHPMAIEQQGGITMQKAEEYFCLLTRLAGS